MAYVSGKETNRSKNYGGERRETLDFKVDTKKPR